MEKRMEGCGSVLKSVVRGTCGGRRSDVGECAVTMECCKRKTFSGNLRKCYGSVEECTERSAVEGLDTVESCWNDVKARRSVRKCYGKIRQSEKLLECYGSVKECIEGSAVKRLDTWKAAAWSDVKAWSSEVVLWKD